MPRSTNAGERLNSNIPRAGEIDYNKGMSSDNPGPPIPYPPPEPDSTAPPRPIPPAQVIVIGQPQTGERQSAGPQYHVRPPRTRRALILFLLTCVSTFSVQFYSDPVINEAGDKPLLFGMTRHELSSAFHNGLMYSGCLMAILGAHELGHYLQARRYGVPASPPYFIPLPISPIGTMGAVIVQQSGVADRKSMFDIAISGPLAGLVFALPATYWGIVHAQVQVMNVLPHAEIRVFGEPLLLKWMVHMVHGKIPEGSDIFMNPVLFAGWVGILITAINLVPIGQLDGGHILYCLIGRRAHFVARALFFLGATIVAYSYFFGDNSLMGWWLMLLLIWCFGTRHPPTANDSMPLGPVRIGLGWLTLMFVFIGLTATPFGVYESKPKQRQQIERDADQEIRI